MKRVEDPRLLTGKGKYIDDIDLPNMAHAAVRRQPPRSCTCQVDRRSRQRNCRASSGIYGERRSGTNRAGGEASPSPPVPQYCMAIDKIRHVGEVVAAVVAEDPSLPKTRSTSSRWNTNHCRQTSIRRRRYTPPARQFCILSVGQPIALMTKSSSSGPVDEDLRQGGRGRPPQSEVVEIRGPAHRNRRRDRRIDEGTGRYTCHANTSFYNVVNFVIAGALEGTSDAPEDHSHDSRRELRI